MSEENGNGRARAIRAIQNMMKTEGRTEGELERHSEMIAELLVKYHLSMSDIPSSEVKKDPVVKDSDLLTDRTEWVKTLMGHVAKLYFCGYYFEAVRTKYVKALGLDKINIPLYGGGHANFYIRHSFIGREVDITVAKMMGEYLVKSMMAICREEQKKVPAHERTSFRYSFMNACTWRLCHRLQEKLHAAQNEGVIGTTNLPAVRSIYEQAQDAYREWLKGEGIELKSAKSVAKITHSGGARSGYDAGDRIGLDQQVGGTGTSGQKRLK